MTRPDAQPRSESDAAPHRYDVAVSIAETILIAATMFSIFVVMTQSAVSLLGRHVPLGWLDDFAVQPHHRRGLVRPFGILVSLVIAVSTQAVIGVGALQPRIGEVALTIYLMELAGAMVWVLRLANVAAGRP